MGVAKDIEYTVQMWKEGNQADMNSGKEDGSVLLGSLLKGIQQALVPKNAENQPYPLETIGKSFPLCRVSIRKAGRKPPLLHKTWHTEAHHNSNL